MVAKHDAHTKEIHTTKKIKNSNVSPFHSDRHKVTGLMSGMSAVYKTASCLLPVKSLSFFRGERASTRTRTDNLR